MPFLEDLGMQAAQQATGGLIGGTLGAIFGRGENRRQYHQQKKLQGLQIRGQKELTDYNMIKQLEMFNKTGYEAQVKQLEAAGLNKGLLYGMGGGAGGSTTVNTGTVGGSNAQKSDFGSFTSAGMGMNLALMDAQREVMKSQARLNNVEANKKEGVDTEESKARRNNIDQDTKKKWEETFGSHLANLVTSYLQSNDIEGKGVDEDGNAIAIVDSAAMLGARAAIQKTIAEKNMTIDENKRRELMNDKEIEKLSEEINLLHKKGLTEVQILENLIKEGKIKDSEIRWNDYGLTKDNFGSFLLQMIKNVGGKK